LGQWHGVGLMVNMKSECRSDHEQTNTSLDACGVVVVRAHAWVLCDASTEPRHDQTDQQDNHSSASADQALHTAA
jgi:hypothetical protein